MKILIISLAGIGDTLFATPLIHELRANFPEAQIDALVHWAGSRDLLQGNPYLNSVYQKNLIKAGRLGSLKYLWPLRKNRYDVSINTHPQSRIDYRLVARWVAARVRLSHEYDNSGWFDRLLVNRTIPQDYGRACIDNNLAFLKLLDARPVLPKHGYEIFLSSTEHAWAEGFIKTNQLSGRKLLGVHVGSGGTKNLALRRWPVERYLELIRRVTKAHSDLAVLLFGGPEEEKANEQLLAEAAPAPVFYPTTKTLREAAALVQHCDLFLSVDTALMHIAAALRVPNQIVIETPTWNKPIEPYRDHFILVKNPAVAGKNLQYYRYDGRGIRGTAQELAECMASVTVDSVFRAVAEGLGARS